jgi:hypothetical protein
MRLSRSFWATCFIRIGCAVALVLSGCGGQASPVAQSGAVSGAASGAATGSSSGDTGGTTGAVSGAWATTGAVASGSTGVSSGTSLPLDAGLACPSMPPAGHRVPPEHRAQVVVCPSGPSPDGGAQACTTNADCVGDAAPTAYVFCVQGLCSTEPCATDADCGANGVCACAGSFYGGNASHGNVCIPADCHTDAECGAGEYCVTGTGYCGSFTGYHCMKATARCIDPTTDCTGCGLTGPACEYNPIIDDWVCALSLGCNG